MRRTSSLAILVTALSLPAFAMLALGGCGPTSSPTTGDDDGVGDTCHPGDSGACYDGPGGTNGTGACTGGTHTCDDSGHWGACEGEVVPHGEICGNNVDDNCNGQVDEMTDDDGDGYTTCAGDCCDSVADGCDQPALVNPGAFEVSDNTLDDDCDGMVDESAATACDTGLASNSGNALDYAKAIDLCQMATNGSWGVVDAALVRADDTGAPNASQRSIRSAFGGVQVQGGASFAVLSTGAAAAVGQTSPGYVDPQQADELGGSSGFPAGFLAANGGTLPNAPGCPEPDLTGANDPVMLKLRIKTPTNAKSFRLAVNFMSSEYPEWVCSPFNDFFVVLLDSAWDGQPANPADKNLAVYTSPSNQKYPVGVNLGFGDTGLFRQCVNGPTGCDFGSTAGNISTCTGTNELTGTGLDTLNPEPSPAAFGEDGYCGANNREGGGTGWLVTEGNVKGGETITLRIGLWDTSDGFYDSTAIIDKFEWSVDAAQPGTVIP
ncbi:MAG TPA: MopE-related protein [Kofleriaceae bacterium]|nr:MopE-related protein [Kofleriaceae bacterium]